MQHKFVGIYKFFYAFAALNPKQQEETKKYRELLLYAAKQMYLQMAKTTVKD